MAGFDKRRRLRRGSEFRKAFEQGAKVDTRLFRLVGHRNGSAEDRLGLAVGRGVGPAVTRNRVKRLLREAFRRSARSLGGWDLVVVARAPAGVSNQQEVDRELGGAIERLLRRAEVRRLGSASRAPGR